MQRRRWRLVFGTVLLLAALVAVGLAVDAARGGHEVVAVRFGLAALGALLTLWLLVLSVHLVGHTASP